MRRLLRNSKGNVFDAIWISRNEARDDRRDRDDALDARAGVGNSHPDNDKRGGDAMRLMQVQEGPQRPPGRGDRRGRVLVRRGLRHGLRPGDGGDRKRHDDRGAGRAAPGGAARPTRRRCSPPAASLRRSIIPIPAHLIVTGTGLTHLGSAATRDAMHQKVAEAAEETLTDSMKMFRMGLEGGKPKRGKAGRPAGVVLQGRRPLRRRARRAAGLAGLRRGRRRGAGGRRHLRRRQGRHAVPDRLRAAQRVLRPRHGAAELSLARPFQAAAVLVRARNSCSATCRTTSAAPRASGAARR